MNNIPMEDGLEKIKEILLAEGEMELYLDVVAVIRRHLEKKNVELQKRNRELQKRVKIKESMVFDNSAYWVREGDKKDGPFCYRCWHETSTLIRMNPCGNSGQSECIRCNSREHTGV